MTLPKYGTPRPGQFGLTKIHGWAGIGIKTGQALLRLRHPLCPVQHGFLVLDNDEVIEAEPGGARIMPLSYYTETSRVRETWYSDLNLTDTQVDNTIIAARLLKDIPYNWVTYWALAAKRFGISTPHIDDLIKNKGYQMCTQLIDWSLHLGGVELYDNGKLPQNVIPSDLWNDFILRKKQWPIREK